MCLLYEDVSFILKENDEWNEESIGIRIEKWQIKEEQNIKNLTTTKENYSDIKIVSYLRRYGGL